MCFDHSSQVVVHSIIQLMIASLSSFTNRRAFSFDGTKLRGSAYKEGAVSEPVAPPSGDWSGAQGLLVERVAFLGLPKSAKGYSAKLPSGTVRRPPSERMLNLRFPPNT